jgi:hypothetical protein
MEPAIYIWASLFVSLAGIGYVFFIEWRLK